MASVGLCRNVWADYDGSDEEVSQRRDCLKRLSQSFGEWGLLKSQRTEYPDASRGIFQAQPTQKHAILCEYHQRQLGDAFRFSLPPVAHAYVEYPQRELGDRFRSSLGAQRTTANLNSRRGLNLKAGLGAFTDSRRWYPHWFPFSVGRSDLKHPPASAGGIPGESPCSLSIHKRGSSHSHPVETA